MPFDPNLPASNSPIVSAELRNQFTALKALIDAQAAQIADLQSQLNAKPSTDDVIGLAAANIDGFTQLGSALSDPPTHDEVQTILDCLNQLIVSLQAHANNN